MKSNYILPALSLLLLTGCGSQKKIVQTQQPGNLILPSFELPIQQTTVETQDTLMQHFFPKTPKHEVRAVWLTTLGGLDWPTTKANTPERIIKQKAELTAILDKYQQAGINTVLLQTRVRGSVIYPSDLEPWDLGLTGQYGKNPGYDPLKFAVEECHKRGMEIQAWLVAIPIGKVTLNNGYGKQSVVKRQKALCVRSGDEWFMDPGNPATPDYLASIAREIVSHYDVDGINLDYIRYPEEPHLLNDKKNFRKYGKGMSLADWRRQNITNCIRAIYKAVKECEPWVKVSSSPIGKYQDLSRYSSFGWNSHDKVYQETESWFKEGIHDEIFPMMYFDGKHFYPFASDWQENNYGRAIVPGLGIYFLDKSLKNWPLDIISRQIGVIRNLNMGGQAYFRSRFFTDNTKGIYDYAQNRLYTVPSLQPAMNWIKTPAPSSPTDLSIRIVSDGKTIITWKAPLNRKDGPLRYTIYASDKTPVDISDPHNILKTYFTETTYTDSVFAGQDKHRYYAVTATDGYGKESRAIQWNDENNKELEVRNNKLFIPEQLPATTSTEWFVLTDAYNRMVAKIKSGTGTIDLSSIPQGYYKLSITENNNSTLKEVGFFLK